MKKHFIVVPALALVAALSSAAYAEVQNVKVSGDLTALGIARNQFAAAKHAELKDTRALASIARIRLDADLTDNVMTTVRLLNERYWGGESGTTTVGGSEGGSTTVDIDLAYVTLKEFLYSPLTLTVGRQELHFGNEMVVGDVDTNRVVSAVSGFSGGDADLSARKSFDAIRATLNYDPFTVDIIGAKVAEKRINNSDDQNLYGANLKYDINSSASVEAYYFAKDTGAKSSTSGIAGQDSRKDRVDTIGALGKIKPLDALTLSLEGALQFGKYYDASASKTVGRRAWALEGGANYLWKDAKCMPSLTVLGAWFSGPTDPSTTSATEKTHRGWDAMFENQAYGDIANGFMQTNIRLLGGILSVKPTDDLTLAGSYYAYWWDKKFANGTSTVAGGGPRTYSYVMTDKRFVGQEIDLKASYDYTEDVQLGLLTGFLFPGDAFNNDLNGNLVSEVIGSMRVTF